MTKFKRIAAIVLSLAVFCGLFAVFAGCSNNKVIKDLQQQIEELKTQQNAQQSTIDQQQEKIDRQQDAIDELEKEKDSLAIAVDDLKKEVQKQRYNRIKQAYIDFFFKESYPDATSDDAIIIYYVGEYSNCDVVMLEAKYESFLDAIYEITISGVDFVYYNSNILHVCKNTKFYTLQEALDLGLISQKDLADIGAQYAELSENPPERA